MVDSTPKTNIKALYFRWCIRRMGGRRKLSQDLTIDTYSNHQGA